MRDWPASTSERLRAGSFSARAESMLCAEELPQQFQSLISIRSTPARSKKWRSELLFSLAEVASEQPGK